MYERDDIEGLDSAIIQNRLTWKYSGHEETFSDPMAFGDTQSQPGHPALLARGANIFLVWKEFDGNRNIVRSMRSNDNGKHWSAAQSVASSAGGADHPQLVSDGENVFLSWNTQQDGYRLIGFDDKRASR